MKEETESVISEPEEGSGCPLEECKCNCQVMMCKKGEEAATDTPAAPIVNPPATAMPPITGPVSGCCKK